MISGIQYERELVRLLWKRGFAALRAPASGGSTQMSRPDIIAGNSEKGIQLAIEVKTTNSKSLYVNRKSIEQLVDFAQRFGCQPMVAIKFKGKKKSWIFVEPQQFILTPGLNFKITFKDAQNKGIDFKTLIREGNQTKLPSPGKNY